MPFGATRSLQLVLAWVSASYSALSLVGAAGQLLGVRCESQHYFDEGPRNNFATGAVGHTRTSRNKTHLDRAGAFNLGVLRLQSAASARGIGCANSDRAPCPRFAQGAAERLRERLWRVPGKDFEHRRVTWTPRHFSSLSSSCCSFSVGDGTAGAAGSKL